MRCVSQEFVLAGRPSAASRPPGEPVRSGCTRCRPCEVTRRSSLCLDIAGISATNGAEATQWEYWGGQNQIFRIEWVAAGYYELIATHSGRVIDVKGIATGNGAQLHQWDWWSGDNQQWRL